MRRDWQIMALLAAATIAVFWQVSRHEFVNFDDPAYVTHNPMVQQGLTWPGVAWAFGELHGEATYWHPVTWLSHMLDCQLFGLRPAGHHLSSLFLHTLNTVLLFVLLRRMTGRRGPSAMVAALFALHPLQVDSVAWIAERKNLLSTLFFMLTLWAYYKYVQSPTSKVQSPEDEVQSTKANVRSREEEGQGPKSKVQSPKPGSRSQKSEVRNQRSAVRGQKSEAGHTQHATRNTLHASRFTLHVSPSYLLSLLFFALGLMSKSMLVTLPFVMLLLDYWPLRRLSIPTLHHSTTPSPHSPSTPLLRLVLEKLPFLALSAVSSLVTIRGHESLGALVSVEQLPVSDRLANAVVACALYLRKLVWPVDLSVFYLHPGRWPAEAVVGSALLLLGITAAAVWQGRRRPYLIVGWLWFLGMLVPVIGLVQAHVQALADRFAYVPAIGVFVMVVWAVAEWTAQGRKSLGLGMQHNHRSTQINTDESPSELRFSKARARLPDSGPKQSDARQESGPQNLCSSVSICGSLLRDYGLAALVLAGCVWMTSLQLRHWRNSVTLLRRVVQVEPNNFVGRLMLGNTFLEARQLDAALREYQAALRQRPEYPDAWLRVGAVLIEQGKPAEAMPYLLQAIQLAPAWPEPQRRLALALQRQGRSEEARAAYQKLITLMPATAEGCRDLADMLAEGQQFAEAVHYYQEALRLKPDFEPVLNNLAMLRASCPQAEFRDGHEAVQLAEAACRLSQRRNPSYLGALAAAYAEAGRFSDAVNTIQEAQALARATGANDLLPLQDRMLEQFRAGKPFH